MSVHHRSTSVAETDALYQPVSQDEAAASREPNDLQLEDEDVEVAAEFLAHEHAAASDKRVGWIYFILGCAVLLPWNGTSPSFTASNLTYSASSHDHSYAVLLVKSGRIIP